MKIKLLFLPTLFSLLIACQHSDVSNTRKAFKTVEDFYRKIDYSDSSFSQVQHTVVNAIPADAHLTLLYYRYASTYYRSKGEYEKAMSYADSMLSLINLPRNRGRLTKEHALALIAKADVFYNTKHFKEAYYYYSLGSVQASHIRDSFVTRELNDHLSSFLYEEGNYAKAIYFYKLLLIQDDIENGSFERLSYNQGVLNNIGFSFLRMNLPDSAIYYFNKSMVCIEKAAERGPSHNHFCKIAQGIVDGNLAQAYQSKGDFVKAERLYQKSIEMNSQPTMATESALISQQQLAGLYHQEHQSALLIRSLQQVRKGLDTIRNRKVEAQWNFLMSEYSSLKEKPGAALAYLKKYYALKDSIRTEREPISQSNIFEQLQAMQSHTDLILLTKANHQKNVYLCIVGIISLLILIIAIQFLTSYQKSKKHVEKLLDLNRKIADKQDQLEKSLDEIKKRETEKRHILQIVAHDLRNPLSAIKTLATLIEEDYENEDINRDSLSLIKSVCSESNELINSLIEVAEVQNTDFEIDFVDLNSILSRCVELLRLRSKEKNQTIHLSLCPDSVMTNGDASKIGRVFTNIITNAIKFSPSGSKIEVNCQTEKDKVIIKIKDVGIGIPLKYHPSLFDTFTGARRPGTSGEKPFGLGLSICKQIVDKHGGSIWFESKESVGTTFFVQFAKQNFFTPHHQIHPQGK